MFTTTLIQRWLIPGVSRASPQDNAARDSFQTSEAALVAARGRGCSSCLSCKERSRGSAMSAIIHESRRVTSHESLQNPGNVVEFEIFQTGIWFYFFMFCAELETWLEVELTFTLSGTAASVSHTSNVGWLLGL
jgi:hypothetical protein